MDKTQLRRHDLVYVSREGRQEIFKQVSPHYAGEKLKLVEEVFLGKDDIPGFVRRSDAQAGCIPLGFVHYQRLEGNRIRIGAYADLDEVEAVMTPYEVLARKIYVADTKTDCLVTLAKLFELAEVFDLHVGVLGSAALELLTGLPYTDDCSDIDLLLKPAPYDRLLAYYKAARASFGGVNMDFELDLPNGYGVKLAEMFVGTSTVLGKSLVDVNLLNRKDVMQFLA